MSQHIYLTEDEARTYTLDVLQREFREAIEDGLGGWDPMDPPSDAQVAWARDTARRIADNWAMRRDGFVDFALEDAA